MSNPPQGTFATDCHECGRELTVTNGRPDEHHCHFEISIDAHSH